MAERRSLAAVYVVTASVSSLVLSAAYAAFPAARPHLTREDDLLEWLTALAFAAGAFTGIISFMRSRNAPRSYLLVPACALLGMLDELSFGERWLRFTAPTMRKLPVDGAHDMFLVAYDVFETDEPWYLAAYALGATLGLAVLAWLLRPGGLLRAGLAAVFEHAPVPYVAVAVLLLACALILDLDLIETDALVFLEELLEFQTALALVFAGLAVGAKRLGP